MIGRAIVTGGAGFIGSHLVDRLVDEGATVLVIDDLSTGHLDNLTQARAERQVQIHQMDIIAPQLADAFARFEPEVVFHLAAQASVSRSVADPVRDALVNVVGTVNVLDASAAAGAARVVFATTGGALYGDRAKLPATERAARRPESPYGISKKSVEDYFRYFRDGLNLDYVMLALANVYGPRQDSRGEAGVVAIFTGTMLERGQPVIFGDGNQTRDFVFVEDVVDAFVRAGEVGGGRFLNIGTGVETSVRELYGLVAEACRFRGEAGQMPARPGDLLRSALDPAAARKHLGWEPFTSLRRGVRLTVDWFRSRSRSGG